MNIKRLIVETLFYSLMLFIGGMLLGSIFIHFIEREAKAEYTGEPFSSVVIDYKKADVIGNRPYNLGDSQPTILYDPEDPTRLYKKWWLGRHNPSDPDLPPTSLQATDRIYFAYSTDKLNWSQPKVVLKGRGDREGTADDPTIGDDHYIGSPSVIKRDGIYFMLYESVSTVLVPVNRIYSPNRVDNWYFNHVGYGAWSLPFCYGAGSTLVPDLNSDYMLTQDGGNASYQSVYGYAPAIQKPGTIPLYSIEVEYVGSPQQQRFNRALLKDPYNFCTAYEKWRTIGGGEPVFWVYTDPGPDRLPFYSCFDQGWKNTFQSTDPNCEGRRNDGLLGYIVQSYDSPDADMSNLNQVFLAVSIDGENWTRFKGPDVNGAVVSPLFTKTSQYGTGCSDPISDGFHMRQAYGVGFPIILFKDGYIEIYWPDDTYYTLDSQGQVCGTGVPATMGCCDRAMTNWGTRLLFSDILNAAAWQIATDNRFQCPSGVGTDLAWSPTHKRYFGNWATGNGQDQCGTSFRGSTNLKWSEYDPIPGTCPNMPDANLLKDAALTMPELLPTGPGNSYDQRWGNWGGMIRTVDGHVIEGANDTINFSMYYASQDIGACGSSAVHELASHLDFDYLEVMVTIEPQPTPTPVIDCEVVCPCQ